MWTECAAWRKKTKKHSILAGKLWEGEILKTRSTRVKKIGANPVNWLELSRTCPVL
jgi:hypothetical protein